MRPSTTSLATYAFVFILYLCTFSVCLDTDLNPMFYAKALAETETMFISCQQDIIGISGNVNQIVCYLFGTLLPSNAPVATVSDVQSCFGTAKSITNIDAGTGVSGNHVFIYIATFDVPAPVYTPNYNRYSCKLAVTTSNKGVVYDENIDILLSITHGTVTFEEEASVVFVAGDNSAGQLSADPATKADIPSDLWTNAPFDYEALTAVEIGDSAFVITDIGELWSLGGTKYPGHAIQGSDVWRRVQHEDALNMVFTHVSLGADHALFLGYDPITGYDHLYVAGSGPALGLGGIEYVVFEEVTEFKDKDIKDIQATQTASYLLLGDGSVWACGRNDHGELATGTTDPSGTFMLVEMFPADFGTVSKLGNTLGAFMFAIDTAGKVTAWGENRKGQLGLGVTDAFITKPTVVTSLSPKFIAQVEGGLDFALALSSDDFQVYGAGDTAYTGTDPAIVTGRTTNVFAKSTLVPTPTAEIAAGEMHGVALTVNANTGATGVYSWGDNSYGQLGLGHDQKSTPTPTEVPTLSSTTTEPFSRVWAGHRHTIAMESTNMQDQAFYEIYPDGRVMVHSLSGSVGHAVLGDIIEYNAGSTINTHISATTVNSDTGVYWIWSDGHYPVTDQILQFTLRNGAREESFKFHIPKEVVIQPKVDGMTWKYTGDSWMTTLHLAHGIINSRASQVKLSCVDGLVSPTFTLMKLDNAATTWDVSIRPRHSMSGATTVLYPYYDQCELTIDGVSMFNGALGTILPPDLTLSTFEIKDVTPYMYYGGHMTVCITPKDMYGRFLPLGVATMAAKAKVFAVYPVTVSSEQTEQLEAIVGGQQQGFYFDQANKRYCEVVDTTFPVSGQIQAKFDGEIVGDEIFMQIRADTGKSKVFVKEGTMWPPMAGEAARFCISVFDISGVRKITSAPPLSVELIIRGDADQTYHPSLDPSSNDYCVSVVLPAGHYSYIATYNGLQQFSGAEFTVAAAPKTGRSGPMTRVFDFMLTVFAVLLSPVVAGVGVVGGVVIAAAGIVFGVVMVRNSGRGEKKVKGRGQYEAIGTVADDGFGSAPAPFVYDAI
ncbi:E3 ubiquitin-protein ligase HERC3 [Carpediemonas membranifera]|uniref:E3 ubiquitin-protein ligase HERC3 n=1 Tax=Carpediemonas membranifera TaxID=201153 RepID=A0A8J6E476_9EUKA|nr:E3 ubiquitin-protein ligase HERC3 [Carpediemonas membranifera]|eukprot:KAG9396863.1 E3 ubiquitin-protein ligase HERC3 [Carpediemonas membranifera]